MLMYPLKENIRRANARAMAARLIQPSVKDKADVSGGTPSHATLQDGHIATAGTDSTPAEGVGEANVTSSSEASAPVIDCAPKTARHVESKGLEAVTALFKKLLATGYQTKDIAAYAHAMLVKDGMPRPTNEVSTILVRSGIAAECKVDSCYLPKAQPIKFTYQTGAGHEDSVTITNITFPPAGTAGPVSLAPTRPVQRGRSALQTKTAKSPAPKRKAVTEHKKRKSTTTVRVRAVKNRRFETPYFSAVFPGAGQHVAKTALKGAAGRYMRNTRLYRILEYSWKQTKKVKRVTVRRIIEYSYKEPLRIWGRREIIGRRWLKRLPKGLQKEVRQLLCSTQRFLRYAMSTGRLTYRMVRFVIIQLVALSIGFGIAFGIIWAVSRVVSL